MSNSPQNIQMRLENMSAHLYQSNFVKALRSIYTRINQFFEHILKKDENKGLENKKGNNLSKESKQESLEGNDLSEQGQSKTPITNRDRNLRVKKENPALKPASEELK